MIRALLLFLPLLAVLPAADEFAELRDRAKANKQLLVSTWLKLDADSEARFTPVYEQYQREMGAITRRAELLIAEYADALAAGTMTDDRATRYITASLDVEADQIALRRKYIPIVSKVLPAQTAMRYLQLEGKLWAVARFDAASTVPLVPRE